MNSVKVFSPASIGNIGPGFDVLGLAIDGLGDTVEAREISGNEVVIENIFNADHDISNDPDKNTAGIAAKETLRALGIKNGVGLILTKGMPSGSGLGSSAASAAAGAYAVNKLFNGGLSEDELILAAMKGEAYVSGGYFADNVAPSILGGATLTQSIDPLKVSKLGTIDELILVLIIPNIQILTKDSRDVIPNKIDKKNFITNMANTASITAAFCKNDYALLKDNLIDVIFEPARTKLIPGLADIKLAAVKAGADGCTISGSGPAIFAISNSHQRAKKIKYEMEKEFINHGVECTGFITTPSKVGSREVTME
ncbi:MAG TPA: homoserine kinase [Candidatus Marinimicrobia bacterium]|nr:homoserine kinase [Candidatus Neomarinimicrobiota bacterium]